MDVKILGVLIIAALFGGAIGYGFTYLSYDPIIWDLRDQIQTVFDTSNSLTTVVHDLNTTVDALTTNPISLLANTSIAQLQSNITTLHDSLSRLKGTSLTHSSSLMMLLTNLEALNTTLSTLQSDVIKGDATVTQLNTTLIDLDTSVRQFEITVAELFQNITMADVHGQLTNIFTDLGVGADRLEVKGTIINFGIDIAYNARINVTWILDGIDYVHETIDLGDMPGRSIRGIDTSFWFDCSGRSITFTYTIIWDR